MEFRFRAVEIRLGLLQFMLCEWFGARPIDFPRSHVKTEQRLCKLLAVKGKREP